MGCSGLGIQIALHRTRSEALRRRLAALRSGIVPFPDTEAFTCGNLGGPVSGGLTFGGVTLIPSDSYLKRALPEHQDLSAFGMVNRHISAADAYIREALMYKATCLGLASFTL